MSNHEGLQQEIPKSPEDEIRGKHKKWLEMAKDRAATAAGFSVYAGAGISQLVGLIKVMEGTGQLDPEKALAGVGIVALSMLLQRGAENLGPKLRVGKMFKEVMARKQEKRTKGQIKSTFYKLWRQDPEHAATKLKEQVEELQRSEGGYE